MAHNRSDTFPFVRHRHIFKNSLIPELGRAGERKGKVEMVRPPVRVSVTLKPRLKSSKPKSKRLSLFGRCPVLLLVVYMYINVKGSRAPSEDLRGPFAREKETEWEKEARGTLRWRQGDPYLGASVRGTTSRQFEPFHPFFSLSLALIRAQVHGRFSSFDSSSRSPNSVFFLFSSFASFLSFFYVLFFLLRTNESC